MLVPLSVLISSLGDGGSCYICLFNDSASIFGPACWGLPGCWRSEYLHRKVRVIYIKSVFPIGSETPTTCFSASVAIFTIFAQEICFMCDLCVGHRCSVGGVCKDLWWSPNYWVCGDVYFRRVFFCVHTGCLTGYPAFSGFCMTFLGLFPCMVPFCPGVSVLN